MALAIKITEKIKASPSAHYFELHQDGAKRLEWMRGFIVEIDAFWFFTPKLGAKYSKLPDFIKCREDAETLIAYSNRWYQQGLFEGY